MNIQQLRIILLSLVLVNNRTLFGMENASLREKHAKYNLEKLYENPNPKKVKRRLRKKYVTPVVLDIFPLSLGQKNSQIPIDVINPFSPSFYPNPEKQSFDEKIAAIERKRLKKAFSAWEI